MRLINSLFFLLVMNPLYSQIADFPFINDFDDVVNGYSANAFGSPTFINDNGNQVLQLEGDQYLSMPNLLHESIDINQNVELQVKFKITDTYDNAPFAGTGEFGREGKRILVSNKNHHIFSKGFEIYVAEQDEEYRVFMSFGDDTGTGGTFIFNDRVPQNEWIALKLILRLNEATPSIGYKINEFYSHFPLNALDVALFKESLNTQQIWLGTDANNEEGDIGGYAFAETSIDYFKIFNPPFVGNSAAVENAITALTNHVNDSNPLTETQQKAALRTVIDNWDQTTYAAISSTILNYISTYESEEGTVFQFYREYVDPKVLAVPRYLQFMLTQWMLDHLYTTANASNMSGISFLDHQIMPGIVASAAPRMNASTTVDGTYNTNPGYSLNNQTFVIRPTGYYVAPGELVNITLPAALVDEGVKVHVGAHFVDLREDYAAFSRYPTLATKFNVNNSTITVANPFGGAIYLIFPDGSNFGAVSVQFTNVVKSPYYSSKTGFGNSLTQYQTDLSNGYVNWVDIESDNFMCTFPKAIGLVNNDAEAILNPFNTMMAQYNVLAGRPPTKIRSEYVISEPQSYTQGTYPAAYPMSIPNGDLEESDPEAIPVSVLNPQFFMSSYDGTTVLHELGHLHNFPTMYDEDETNVDLPAVIAFEAAFNAPLDTGLYYAAHYQYLHGDHAALDWILDPKFRKSQAAEFPDVSYQCRGVAKYVDVARLFSWDTLGLIHKYWYDLNISGGLVSNGIRNVPPDEYIEVASNQLGFNFAPLWELWGSLPGASLMQQLDSYPKETRIKDRILHYRSLVPLNATEFQAIYNEITPNLEEHHRERYHQMLNYYDESVADSILARIDNILCRYFDRDSTCPLPSVNNCNDPVPINCGQTYSGNTFSGEANFTDYTVGGCADFEESGPEIVHVLTTTTIGDITAMLTNIEEGDLDVIILSACNINNCLALDDDLAIATNQPAGTYYIVVDGHGGSTGTYDLTVTSADCNSCNNPPPVSGTIPTGTYQIDGDISTAGTVNSNSDVSVFASNSITLTSGFYAQAGSTFLASIKNCSNAASAEFRNTNKPVTITRDLQVYPNPTNGQTNIQYELEIPSMVSLMVYDLYGKRIHPLTDKVQQAAGKHLMSFDAFNLTPGIYLVVLRTDSGSQTKRLVVGR